MALTVAVLAGAKLALLLVMGFTAPSKPGTVAASPSVQATAAVSGMAARQPGEITGNQLPGQQNMQTAAATSGPTLTPAQAVQAVRAVILDESLALAAQQTSAAAPAPAPPQDKKAQPESVLSVQQLKTRAEALDRQEQALKSLEADLNTRLSKLQELETLLKGMLTEAKSIKEEHMRHLIDVYSNMKAKQAASALEALDELIAVKILSGMKGRQAGEILSNVSAKKAAKLSEDLTKLQVGPNLPERP